MGDMGLICGLKISLEGMKPLGILTSGESHGPRGAWKVATVHRSQELDKTEVTECSTAHA